MRNNDRTQDLEKKVIERQETYHQLPSSSLETEQILEELEEALTDLAEHTGQDIENLIPKLEHKYMINIAY